MHIWTPPISHHVLHREHEKGLSPYVKKLNSMELKSGLLSRGFRLGTTRKLCANIRKET
jgi:hypothetical protein